MRLNVKVVPGASRSGIAGWLGEVLKVRVAAPPEGGRANAAVERLIAEALGLPRAQVRLISGASSARKTLEIAGMAEREVLARLKGGEGE
ncbi:hypothetical protein SVA_2204 [Sulfurifustis variabilis]|uniref:UPF0235 protein SVA_2204 n=1 Tax=Sulfurifustis variabilis TaxID=1675686 RepID=A0A1B4VAK9_9GAMM|nr:DUF167 domain-containing protein [Sulfurifustis variabilis]BAU48754.1 hypothetical protein SVA_2204 [Sulfurifustis variabilis]